MRGSPRFRWAIIGLGAVAAAFVSTAADARCASEWFRVVNGDLPMATNGRVLVEGFSHRPGGNEDMEKRHPVLRNAKGDVALRVVERREGEVGTRQYLLEPVRALAADQVYRLDFDGRPAFSELDVHTGAATDITPPRWLAKPVVRSRDRHELGCGPSVSVAFALSVDDDSRYLLAHAEVTRLRDGHRIAGFVPIENGAVSIGRGMCSGMWELESGAEYEVRISIIDSAGQSAAGDASAAQKFRAP